MAEKTEAAQETTVTELTETTQAPEKQRLPEITDGAGAKEQTAEALPKGEKRTEAETNTISEKPVDEASERISALEGKLAAREAGVPKEYTEDVLTLARAEMKKNGASLEEAIGAVLERHPSFKGTPPASITTGAAVKNDVPGNADDAEVKMIMGIK